MEAACFILLIHIIFMRKDTQGFYYPDDSNTINNITKRQSNEKENTIFLPLRYSKSESQPFVSCPILTPGDTSTISQNYENLNLIRDPMLGAITFVPSNMKAVTIVVTSQGKTHSCPYKIQRGREAKVRVEVEFITKQGGTGLPNGVSSILFGTYGITFGDWDSAFPSQLAIVTYIKLSSAPKKLKNVVVQYMGSGTWEVHMIILRFYFPSYTQRYYSQGKKFFSFSSTKSETVDVNEMTTQFYKPYFDHWLLKINLDGTDQTNSFIIIRIYDELNNFIEKDFDAEELSRFKNEYWELPFMMEQMMGVARSLEICIMNQGEKKDLLLKIVKSIEIESPYAKFEVITPAKLEQSTCNTYPVTYIESK